MKEMTNVQRIMTKRVITLTPDTPVPEAIELLTTNRISGAPVVDGKKLVGILSQHDCITWLTSTWYYNEMHGLVRDYMTHEVTSIGENESIFTAADKILKNRLRRLPVINNAGELVGIISRHDVIKAGNAYYQEANREDVPDSGYIPDKIKAKLGKSGMPHLTRKQ